MRIYTELGNYYGTVFVEEKNGKYFMGIDDYDSEKKVEINQKIYNAIEQRFK